MRLFSSRGYRHVLAVAGVLLASACAPVDRADFQSDTEELQSSRKCEVHGWVRSNGPGNKRPSLKNILLGEFFRRVTSKHIPAEIIQCATEVANYTEKNTYNPDIMTQRFGGYQVRVEFNYDPDTQESTLHSIKLQSPLVRRNSHPSLTSLLNHQEEQGWATAEREDLRPGFKSVFEQWRQYGHDMDDRAGQIVEGMLNTFLFLEIPNIGPVTYVNCDYNPTSELCGCTLQGPVPVPYGTPWSAFVPDLPEHVLDAILTKHDSTGVPFRRRATLALSGQDSTNIVEPSNEFWKTDEVFQSFTTNFKVSLRKRLNASGIDENPNTYQAFSLFHGASFDDQQPLNIPRKDGTAIEIPIEELKLLKLWSEGVPFQSINREMGLPQSNVSVIMRRLAYRLGLPHSAKYPSIIHEAYQLIQKKTSSCGLGNLRAAPPTTCVPIGMRLDSTWVDVENADALRTAAATLIHPNNSTCPREKPYNDGYSIKQRVHGTTLTINKAHESYLEREGNQLVRTMLSNLSPDDPLTSLKGLGAFQPIQKNYWWNSTTDKNLLELVARSNPAVDPFTPLLHMRISGHEALFLSTSAWVNCQYNPSSPGCYGKTHGIALIPPHTDWKSSRTRTEHFLSRMNPAIRPWIRSALLGHSLNETIGHKKSIGHPTINSTSMQRYMSYAYALAGIIPKSPNTAVNELIARVWEIDFSLMNPTIHTKSGVTYLIPAKTLYSLTQIAAGKSRSDYLGTAEGYATIGEYRKNMLELRQAVSKEPDFPKQMSNGRLIYRVWMLNRNQLAE